VKERGSFNKKVARICKRAVMKSDSGRSMSLKFEARIWIKQSGFTSRWRRWTSTRWQVANDPDMGDILRIYKDKSLLFTFFNLEHCLELSNIGWSTKEEGLFSITTPSSRIACRTENIGDAVACIQIMQGNEPLGDDDIGHDGEPRSSSWKDLMVSLSPQASVIMEGSSNGDGPVERHDPPPPAGLELGKRQISEKGKELLMLNI
jgi:hypothetical protein